MRVVSIILVVLGLVLISSFHVHADPGVDDAFYRNCIEHKITQCRCKAERVNSRGDQVRIHAEKAQDQALFYHEHKEKLVEAMIRQNVPPKQYKVHYFLIKAYRQPEQFARP